VLTRSRLVAFIILFALGLVIWRLTQRSSTGDCGIHASAAMVTRDAPISRSMNITTDMLMLRNTDGDTWKDVALTASGYQQIGNQGKQPTGPYVLRRADVHDKGGLYAIQMNDFEKADGGSRWVSLTMKAEVFTVKATVNGTSCIVEITPGSK
jgi:hypothetical protein